MAGKFGSLANFIHSVRQNDRRFRTNIEAIIEKYEKEDENDDVIDLKLLQVIGKGDSLASHKISPFGFSKLATTLHKERNISLKSTNIDEKASESVDESCLTEDLDVLDAEENCTKIFSFICVEENDPSDAETLSSTSTHSDDTWEDWSSTSDKKSADGQNIHKNDKNGLFSNSWYSLKKSTSISSENSGGKKKDSTGNRVDQPTRKVKKLQLISDRFANSAVCSNLHNGHAVKSDADSVESVKDSPEYQTNSEDSLSEPCHDDLLSYKTDIVRAWVIDQQEIQHITEACDDDLDSGKFTLGGVATMKKGVSSDSENEAMKMSLADESNTSADSGATYVIPVTKPLDYNNNSHTDCTNDKVDMIFDSVFSPRKLCVNSDDVKQWSPSRRILRARKRFKSKPPLVSMTEQQLQEFFDSPRPDFSMFYPSLGGDLSKDSIADNNTDTGNETETSDSCVVSKGEIKYKEVEKYFEGNTKDVVYKEILHFEGKQVITNNVRCRLPQKKTSFKPTKLKFLPSTNNEPQLGISMGERTGRQRHIGSNNPALYTEEDVIGYDGTLIDDHISTDTFLVNSPHKDMLGQETASWSLRKMLDRMKESETSNFNISDMSGKPYIRLESEKTFNYNKVKSSISNNCLMVSDKEQCSIEKASFSSADKQNTCKRREEVVSRSTSHRPLEMSPVSRLSCLKLSSPVQGTKLTAVYSKKTNKHKYFQNNSSPGAVCSTNGKSSRMIPSLSSSCQKEASLSDVSPSGQKPGKTTSRQPEPTAAKHHAQTVWSDKSPSHQKPAASNLSHRFTTPLRVVGHLNSKCLYSKPEDSSECKRQVYRMTNHYNFEPSVEQASLMKQALMQQNGHVKWHKKHASTPVKKHVTPFKVSKFGFNDTLSTIAADVD